MAHYLIDIVASHDSLAPRVKRHVDVHLYFLVLLGHGAGGPQGGRRRREARQVRPRDRRLRALQRRLREQPVRASEGTAPMGEARAQEDPDRSEHLSPRRDCVSLTKFLFQKS